MEDTLLALLPRDVLFLLVSYLDAFQDLYNLQLTCRWLFWLRWEFVKRFWERARPKRGYATLLLREYGFVHVKINTAADRSCKWSIKLPNLYSELACYYVLFPSFSSFSLKMSDRLVVPSNGNFFSVRYWHSQVQFELDIRKWYILTNRDKGEQERVIFNSIKSRIRKEYAGRLIASCLALGPANFGSDQMVPFFLDFLRFYDLDLPIVFNPPNEPTKAMFIDWPGLERELCATQIH